MCIRGGIILSFLLLSACSGNKDKPASAGRDATPGDDQQRAGQLFNELDGKPVQTQSTQTSGTEVSPQVVVSTSTPSTPAPKPGEMVVVEIDTFRVFNDNVSIKDAETQTRNFIRELALDKALPSDVSLTSLTTSMYVERNARFDESTAKGIFMMSSSAGRFLKEDFLKREPSFDSKQNSLKYRMHYKAQILPQEKTYNPSMSLQVKLSETFLKDGSEFAISITPNTDGYLYFFDFLSDNSVALVFPNQDMSDNRIKAGQRWEQDAVAVCDPQKDFTIETLYFVFSQDPISGWEDFRSNRSSTDLVFSAGEESFILFQNWLGKSDPRRRVEKMAQIHIYK